MKLSQFVTKNGEKSTFSPYLFIGTSGWSYDHWKTVFYPENVLSKDRLNYYSGHFPCVEINSTFYRLPSEQAVKNWFTQTPADFIFAVKANRFITHQKHLRDYELTTKNFFQRIRLLKNKLGPILFQLPPHFKINVTRLEEFIWFLPKKLKYSFEFRDASWYTDEVYDLLRKREIALCLGDLNGILSPLEITADFTYVRLHGPKTAYTGSYNATQLHQWADRIVEWLEQNISVYIFFNNDLQGHAVHNALKLKDYLFLQAKK
jgi:uncharacterized protein YecE (DUF72 family)